MGGVTDSPANTFEVIPASLLAPVFLVVFRSSLISFNASYSGNNVTHNSETDEGQVMSVKERLFVEAAKVIDWRGLRVLFKHVVPRTIPLTYTTLEMGAAIIMEAEPPRFKRPTLPKLGQDNIRGSALHNFSTLISLVPRAFLVYTIVGMNLIGNGLLKIVTPKLVQR